LEEWVDEDNFGPTITEEDRHISVNKNSRVVVLKHMFTLKELEEDPSLLLDLKEDVREECETLGEVTNVVLYDVRQFPSISPFSHQLAFFYRKSQMVS
jgi:HIV Tat-specific factor 1